MKYWMVLAVLSVCCFSAAQAGEGLLTALEANGFQESSKNEEVVAFLTALAEASKKVKIQWAGRSAGQRGLVAVSISNDPDFHTGQKVATAKPVVMLLGSQHGSEPSGAEALQICARDLAMGKLAGMLEYLDFILLPVSNPDGFDRKLRVNAEGVNLSTDYILISQPETLAVAGLLSRFQPQVLLDIHESALLKKKSLAGQGYLTDFETQFECANHAMTDAEMLRFSLNDFLPALLSAVSAKGLKADRYIGEITALNQPIQHGGLSLRNLRNYAGFQGVFAWLLENRLDPPGPYPTPRNIRVRVEKQYMGIVQFLEQIIRQRGNIVRLVSAAKKKALSVEKGRSVCLSAHYVPDPTAASIVLPLRRVGSDQTEQVRFPNHTRVEMDKQIPLPAAYAVTGEHEWVAELLRRHHIDYSLQPVPENRGGFLLSLKHMIISPPSAGKSRLGIRLDITETESTLRLKPGDLLIPTDQSRGLLAALLLDPRSTDSIFQEPANALRLAKQNPLFIATIKN